MYKVLTLEEVATFIADNITTSISFDFYDHWDTKANPDGPVGVDAYNCKAELVNGVVHIVANAYGGGAPYCYCASRTFFGPARLEFIHSFVNYLKAATESKTVVLNTEAIPVGYEREEDGDISMRPSEFARLVWDCIEKKRSYAFSKYPCGHDVHRVKLINVAEAEMIVCNNASGSCLWWCELADDTLEEKMNSFALFLKSAGFHRLYLRK